MQNISPVKERILQFIEYLGISKREFYSQTGISRGTLESNTGITEETLAKFFAKFTNVNPTWVLLGTGVMIKQYEDNKSEMPVINENRQDYSSCQKCKDKEDLLNSQRELIESLKQQIGTFTKYIEHLEGSK